MISAVSGPSALPTPEIRALSATKIRIIDACAPADSGRVRRWNAVSFAVFLQFAVLTVPQAHAQSQTPDRTSSPPEHRAATIGLFIAGGALGLGLHEGGHLFFDIVFDADPGVRRVDFHGIPFFAITHRGDLSPAREFTVSSAGFWVQHIGSEWLLTRRPHLRQERAPLAKGLLAFNVIASGAYAGAAFSRSGPAERDTRGMAAASQIDERWIGVSILAPALLDTWRYFQPDARSAVWISRGAKLAGALLVVRAATRDARPIPR